MQKKILALAVAGLMSGTAFATANVTIYGIVDMGYSHMSGSEVEAGVPAIPANAAHKNRNAIDSGNQATSRIGFRGTEDLGGGLSAGFTLEFGLTPDRGDGGVGLTDRTQTLSLTSKTAGTLVMGRMLNPARQLVNAQDPFGGNGVGSAQNVQWQTTWADNVIAYASPTFSGFNVTAGYTHSLVGNEAVVLRGAPNLVNLEGFVIVPRYAVGPITAGFSYESFDLDGTAAANQDLELRRWNLAGSYDFGVVRVGLTYGEMEYNDIGAPTGSFDGKQWMLSGRVPVTAKGTLLASYNRARYGFTGEPDAKASQWAIGYNHAMSKRTNAYLTYATLSTNTAARGVFSLDRTYDPLADAPAVVRGFTNGLNIGLRHNF